MECPHCHQEIPGKKCPSCGLMVPEDSCFCMACGAAMEEKSEHGSEEEAFDMDDRVLCPDGTCTGIIVDGKCTECGKTLEDE